MTVQQPIKVLSAFERLTNGLARFIGRPFMLILCSGLAVAGIVAYVSRNDLAINGTNLAINIVTLMLLPILQATQNRDGAALQVKIDELIRATADARDSLIGLEQRTESEIEELRPVLRSVTDPEAAEPVE
ncbi:low affinity Fe/Cu permease [Sphingomonas sp. F9_3S_D5_B_2]